MFRVPRRHQRIISALRERVRLPGGGLPSCAEYIYIYIEREREMYLSIYIERYREREKEREIDR